MKKKLCLMLVAAMLVSSLASCSESKVNEEKETTSTAETVANVTASEETEEETKKYLDDLPEKMDFGGTSMRFIVEEGGNETFPNFPSWLKKIPAKLSILLFSHETLPFRKDLISI